MQKRVTRIANALFLSLGLITVAHASSPAANQALWLDASQNVIVDGSGKVTSWGDRSGNNHHASVVGAGAVYQNSAIGANPALRFDGSSTWYNLSGQVLTSQQFSIFAVVSDARLPGDGTYREVFSNWSGSNSWTSFFLGTVGNQVRFSDNFDRVGTLVNQGTPFVLSGFVSTTQTSVFQNDTLLGSKEALATRELGGTYQIGTQGGVFEFWQGDIAEILVYNRALSNPEREQTMAYLDTKYFHPVAAVPEPEAYALFLAGIGLMGAVARRRRALSA
jgi:hypothetical protein